MTPDGRLAFPSLAGRGSWSGREIAGAVTLFVEARDVVVRLEEGGEELVTSLQALDGASWRGEALSLHAATDTLHLRGASALDQAWMAISRRACTMPEVTRGLRALGSARGGDVAWQSRFFGPLLQARRRLEEGEPLDWQVVGFDATVLAERLRASLLAVAQERHPSQPPYRRALEAELLDAAEQMFIHLSIVHDAASTLHSAVDAERFVRWREWSAQIRTLFVEADRCGLVIASRLQRPSSFMSGKSL